MPSKVYGKLLAAPILGVHGLFCLAIGFTYPADPDVALAWFAGCGSIVGGFLYIVLALYEAWGVEREKYDVEHQRYIALLASLKKSSAAGDYLIE